MAVNHLKRQPPSIFDASDLWLAMGLFGLVLGTGLLTFGETFFSVVEWLVEISHSGPNSLSPETGYAVRDGIDTWGWTGVVVAAIALPLSRRTLRSKLSQLLRPIAIRRNDDLLPPDRHGPAFILGLVGVLGFTGLAHWSLRTYIDVGWLEGEDGLSEWWSVGTYLAGAAAAGAAAWSLRATRQSLVMYFYLALAVDYFWGRWKRLVGASG